MYLYVLLGNSLGKAFLVVALVILADPFNSSYAHAIRLFHEDGQLSHQCSCRGGGFHSWPGRLCSSNL